MSAAMNRREALQRLALGAAAPLAASWASPLLGACAVLPTAGKSVQLCNIEAFVRWDPDQQRETLILQPDLNANVDKLGLVFTTPSKAIVNPLVPEFFPLLAEFTELLRAPRGKYQNFRQELREGETPFRGDSLLSDVSYRNLDDLRITVLDPGDVNGFDNWVRTEGYVTGAATNLIRARAQSWSLVLVNVNPGRVQRSPDGYFTENVVPIRLVFASQQPVVPLLLNSNINEVAGVQFYAHGPKKMDLPGELTSQYDWLPRWNYAAGRLAQPTQAELALRNQVGAIISTYPRIFNNMDMRGIERSTFQFCKRITAADRAEMTNRRNWRGRVNAAFTRLPALATHLQEGYYLTRFHKAFKPQEMVDLNLVEARIGNQEDTTEYWHEMPTPDDPQR